MPTIRVPDPIYDLIKEFADREHRTVSNAAVHLLATALTGSPVQNTPLPKKLEIGKLPPVETAEYHPQKNNSEPSGSGASLPDAKDILRSNMEQPCCLNEITPCRHWVWDTQTGEGYKNTLSGRLMEVEG